PVAEGADRNPEHAIAGRQGVDDRRLEPAGPRAREDRDVARGPEVGLHPGLQPAEERFELGTAVVDHLARARFPARGRQRCRSGDAQVRLGASHGQASSGGHRRWSRATNGWSHAFAEPAIGRYAACPGGDRPLDGGGRWRRYTGAWRLWPSRWSSPSPRPRSVPSEPSLSPRTPIPTISRKIRSSPSMPGVASFRMTTRAPAAAWSEPTTCRADPSAAALRRTAHSHSRRMPTSMAA